jgi:hypothetical protein
MVDMTLTETREAYEFGKLGENARDFVKKFSPPVPERVAVPVGTFDDIREAAVAEALDEVRRLALVKTVEDIKEHLDGDEKY